MSHPPSTPWVCPDPDAVTATVEKYAVDRSLELYPHQSEALLELATGSNVILATPTGSGKSLVAMAAHQIAVASVKRSFYTAPIKALVTEKFFDLCDALGPENVGMLTGDASVNPDAPVICCTAEILANLALRRGRDCGVDQVVMDEFHFYADPDRGWAWQVPLLEMPDAQFLLMSATLGDVSFFDEDLTRRTGRQTAVIDDAARPVPLEFAYVFDAIHETIDRLIDERKAPVYVVHFTQAEALERAQALTSTVRTTAAQKDAIAGIVGPVRLTTSFGRTLSRLLRHGVGVHHAGMLPRYRRLVEQLAQAGLLRVICGTDTLGVGINVPIRTVLFTALGKYDGTRTRHLTAREFHQIAGRAGRAGFDEMGWVIAQAPEYDVANAKALGKAGKDEKKRRKVVRKGPPPGAVAWTEKTFDRLVCATPETLTSQFRVTAAMVLDVIGRDGDPAEAMRHLLRDNHDPRPKQNRHIVRAIAIYRTLVSAGVVDPTTRRLTIDLPEDFALNQGLSTFALAAMELLDPESPDHALDVVSVIEATLEDPRTIVAAQRNQARGEAVAAMKADGVEYEERMERLEGVTHPQPLKELLDMAYDTYRRGHPWILDYELAPKSIVREMWENGMGFADLVRTYGLTRSEGSVLRYLSDAYKALRASVPPSARSTELDEIVVWLGEVVRQTDSSLLDEWERLLDPSGARAAARGIVDAPPPSVTGNRRAFRAMVRAAVFNRVRLLAFERYEELGDLDDGWSADVWADAMDRYWDSYDAVGTDADARGPHYLMVDEDPGAGALEDLGFEGAVDGRYWLVRQILADPEGDHEWALHCVVDLNASDEHGEASVKPLHLGPDSMVTGQRQAL